MQRHVARLMTIRHERELAKAAKATGAKS